MRRVALALSLATAVVGLTSCDPSEADEETECVSTVNDIDADSPSAGKVTVPSNIDFEETLLIQYVYNGQSFVKSGEYANGVTTFTGLPTGSYEIIFILSCGQGVQEVQGSKVIAVS